MLWYPVQDISLYPRTYRSITTDHNNLPRRNRMKTILILAAMGVLCYSIWPALEKNYVDIRDIPECNWREQPKSGIPFMRPTGTRHRVGVASPPAKSAPIRIAPVTVSVSGNEPIALIKAVSRKY